MHHEQPQKVLSREDANVDAKLCFERLLATHERIRKRRGRREHDTGVHPMGRPSPLDLLQGTRNALAEILEAFVAKELQKWVSTFPSDYYEQMYRLRNWNYEPKTTKRTPLVGRLTNDIVYSRLAPGVQEELQKLAVRDEVGRLKSKLFQGLTTDVGHPRLREHLSAVVAIMKISKTWGQFTDSLEIIAPRMTDKYQMDLAFEEEE